MNTNLIKNKEEYIKLLRDNWYGPNDRSYGPGYDLEKASWISFPEEYPVVVVHGAYYDNHYGRERYETKFVYLRDFELERCQNCQKIKEISELDYGYTDKGVEWQYLCSNCREDDK